MESVVKNSMGLKTIFSFFDETRDDELFGKAMIIFSWRAKKFDEVTLSVEAFNADCPLFDIFQF